MTEDAELASIGYDRDHVPPPTTQNRWAVSLATLATVLATIVLLKAGPSGFLEGDLPWVHVIVLLAYGIGLAFAVWLVRPADETSSAFQTGFVLVMIQIVVYVLFWAFLTFVAFDVISPDLHAGQGAWLYFPAVGVFTLGVLLACPLLATARRVALLVMVEILGPFLFFAFGGF